MQVGSRVRVPFSGGRRRGWVVALADVASPGVERVLPLAVDCALPAFDSEDVRWLRWVAERFAGTLPAVLRHALPPRAPGVEAAAARRGPAPRFGAGDTPATPGDPADRPPCPSRDWRGYTGASRLLRAVSRGEAGAWWLRPLPGDDRAVLVGDLVARCVAAGRGAVVVAADAASPVPDAALAVGGPEGAADWRSPRPGDRAVAFWRGRTGHAVVAAGERSGVFAPVRDLGLVVVDDEANPGLKERRSPRHHAREVALARARMAGAVCVLVSDLPSARLWSLMQAGHVAVVRGDRGAERARVPRVDVVDLDDPRPGTRRARLTMPAAHALSAAVESGGAAIVLASRRGEGAALACTSCRRRLACPVCAGGLRAADADADGERGCGACGWRGPGTACADCGALGAVPLAAGAGRLATELARAHPSAEVVRMEGFDAPGPTARPAVAVLTRGSVVRRPGWLRPDERAAVLVIPDADAALGRPRVDAGEDALRLWLAAAELAERVVVQTRTPGDPAVQALVRWDPEGFWRREAPRRAELRFPPAASLVRLRAPGEDGTALAAELRDALGGDDVVGPDLAGAVLVKASDRRGTLSALAPLRHAWSLRDRAVRVDVDPVEQW